MFVYGRLSNKSMTPRNRGRALGYQPMGILRPVSVIWISFDEPEPSVLPASTLTIRSPGARAPGGITSRYLRV